MSQAPTLTLHVRDPADPLLDIDALAAAGVETRVIDLDEAIGMPSIADDVALVVVEFTPRAAEFIRSLAHLRRSETRWTPLIACCANSRDVEVALALGADDFLFNHDLITVRSRLSVVVQQKLRNDKLDGILNCTFDGIVSIDETGTMLTFNKAAQAMFGFTASEAIGRNVSILMDAEHGSRHDHYLRHYVQTGEEHIIGRGRELRGRTKSGRTFPLFLQVANLRSGRDWLFVGILKNLSLDAQARALQHEVTHDPLTGIANRSHVEATLKAWVGRRSTEGVRRFALLFIDLNDFKAINDMHSHEAGDAVLKAVGARLSQNVAASDVAARLSGDEFVVLLDGVGHPADAQGVAQRLIGQLALPIDYGDQTLAVNASVGIALFPGEGSSPAELLHRADLAMYADKKRQKVLQALSPC